MQRKMILDMPKMDLHCHLDGSMTLKSISDILGREVKAEEVQVAEDCKSLAEYLQKFELPLECFRTEKGVKQAAKDFLLGLQSDNMKYVEVRFAPQLSATPEFGCEKIMNAVLTGLEEAKAECGIEYQVIACMMSHHDEETNARMLKECRPFLGQGLCATDLAGDEARFPRRDFRSLFELARKLDYPYVIHAGECGSVQNVLDAVEMGARRIGHGVAMTGRADAMAACREKRVGIEMCPISNFQTKAVKEGALYPIREFADAGLLVTVNTDNRLVSGTSIGKEMLFLHDKFGITEEELRQYQRNSIEVAFCNEDVKHRLWKQL